ncbi:MAG: hypothetical protein K6A78_01685 [Prevotella sp.]|nr:hypothetical protein [Prevotella sp.]
MCEKDSLVRKIVAVGREFSLGMLMRQAHIIKEQGVPCSVLLLYLVLIRLLDVSLFRFYKTKWFGLLSAEIGKYYQIRWNQEVMYREGKQYLGLGKCQSTDFDTQIADCTLSLLTYTILTLYRRQEYRLSVHGMCSYQIKTPCYNVSDFRAYQPCSIWHEPSGKRNGRPCYWFPCSCVQPPLHGEGIHVPPCLSMWGLLLLLLP